MSSQYSIPAQEDLTWESMGMKISADSWFHAGKFLFQPLQLENIFFGSALQLTLGRSIGSDLVKAPCLMN